ncbi:type III polyketide synthase [Fulvivirga lutea]|uniref:Type III polyketide synthase n=1 Tax=Fulvivirga lutea TaxID=2810512 RepID=A0A975A245_9BACT|nr:type III polyketide synthase [Fulvivirga lutea]QSE98157.1 type III polyketide synthase [Fulvivirga lutea]
MGVSYITAIETNVPKNKVSQKQALQFMVSMNDLNAEESHRLKALYRASGIANRYSVLSDYNKTTEFTFYPNNKSTSLPDTKNRMAIYAEEAVELGAAAAKKCFQSANVKPESITHLITVSCTGLHAPGQDIELINRLGLKGNVERTAINFMGCYAAFNALKLADSISQAADSKVLVVCTELCSIHFQKGKDEDNLLANALFGDGSAAVIVESNLSKKSLEIKGKNCDLLPDGKDEMAWGIGPFGFEMKLSSYVPDIINGGISRLLENYNSKFEFYAIHPGGKKILKVVEQALGINKDKNAQAHHVLKNYGNMSSPTVLFVLKEIWDGLTRSDNEKEILSMAFGPGLTLESMTFKINHNA